MTEVNFLAVVAGAVIQQALGFFWYSPSGFGKPWMAMMGIDQAKMEQMKAKGGMGKNYAIAFVGALVMMYVLSKFVSASGATNLSSGAITGFWVWLGFIATSMLSSVLWEEKPWKLYKINTGFYLVSLVVNGAILAVWV